MPCLFEVHLNQNRIYDNIDSYLRNSLGHIDTKWRIELLALKFDGIHIAKNSSQRFQTCSLATFYIVAYWIIIINIDNNIFYCCKFDIRLSGRSSLFSQQTDANMWFTHITICCYLDKSNRVQTDVPNTNNENKTYSANERTKRKNKNEDRHDRDATFIWSVSVTCVQ